MIFLNLIEIYLKFKNKLILKMILKISLINYRKYLICNIR